MSAKELTWTGGKIDPANKAEALARRSREEHDAQLLEDRERAAAEAAALQRKKEAMLSSINDRDRREPTLMRQVTIAITEEEHARLTAHARAERVTLRKLITHALRPLLDHEPEKK